MNKKNALDSIPAILPSAGRREPERTDGDRTEISYPGRPCILPDKLLEE